MTEALPYHPQVLVGDSGSCFAYNHVFGPETAQQDVYETAVRPLEQRCDAPCFWLMR